MNSFFVLFLSLVFSPPLFSFNDDKHVTIKINWAKIHTHLTRLGMLTEAEREISFWSAFIHKWWCIFENIKSYINISPHSYKSCGDFLALPHFHVFLWFLNEWSYSRGRVKKKPDDRNPGKIVYITYEVVILSAAADRLVN